MNETTVWLIFFGLTIIGLMGVILAGLPGDLLIAAAVLFHKTYLAYFSTWAVALVIVLGIVGYGLDKIESWSWPFLSWQDRSYGWMLVGMGVGGFITWRFIHSNAWILGGLIGAFVAATLADAGQWISTFKKNLSTGEIFANIALIHLVLSVMMVGTLLLDVWYSASRI